MRSTSFAVVVLGCTFAFASANLDCATLANATTNGNDAEELPQDCGGFLGSAAAPELSSFKCEANSKNGQEWIDVFTTCVNGLVGYGVSNSDQSSMCACYKEFVKFGFDNECQEPPLLRALAAKGFRFGVGQPLFSDALTTLSDDANQPTCALEGLDSTTGVYTGPGSLLTSAVSNPPVKGVAQGCIPACATICPYDDCAPAGSITLGGAAFAMVFAAVASLMQ